MPKLAANLSMMFNEVSFLDRFDAAAKAGFKGCEFLFPYAHPKQEVAARLRASGLQIALFNAPPGDFERGERGIAILPERVVEFRDGVALALDYAQALECPAIHCMAGLIPEGSRPEVLRETYLANLRYFAAEARKVGLGIVIEPINSRDIPGYYLNFTAQAIEVIDAVGAENLRLQFDIYHAQIMQGDLAPTIERVLARIGHMQLADTPGRHEPGSGEINYEYLLPHLDRLGYTGWMGCEYRPAGETVAGLAWARRYL